jgi:hypothetical protein
VNGHSPQGKLPPQIATHRPPASTRFTASVGVAPEGEIDLSLVPGLRILEKSPVLLRCFAVTLQPLTGALAVVLRIPSGGCAVADTMPTRRAGHGRVATPQ